MIDWEDSSVVLIKSRGERRDIGSGFVIYQDESFSYVVTCAHVVKAVGGKDYVKVKGKDATVIAYSWENQEDSLDLAVIQVEKLDLPSLNIQPNAQVKDSFSIQGFFYFDPGKSIEIREVKGTLKQAKKFAIKEGDDFINGWELEITSDNLLKEGYSGSPILSQQQEVIGVVTHLLENGSKGSAISIDALAKLWLEMPSELRQKIKQLDAIEQQLPTPVDSGLDKRVSTNSHHTVENSSFPTHSFGSSKTLPPLLPYLANRKEQESQLSDVLQDFLKQATANHLVCIIHGDELQCHYNFVERIRQLYLRQLLELDPQQPMIRKYDLEWPAKLKDLDNLCNQLRKSLAESVSGNSFHTLDKIDDLLSIYFPQPVIIQTYLLTEDLHKQGLDVLNKLLDFCNCLSNNITKQKLIICICVKYKITRKINHKVPLIKWLFSFGGIFFKKYSYQQTNRKIRQYLQKISNSNQSNSQPISLIILPELEGINKAEVENWVRSEYTKQFVGEAMIEPLIQKVGEMFTACDTMPMYDLAEKLDQLIKSLILDQGTSA